MKKLLVCSTCLGLAVCFAEDAKPLASAASVTSAVPVAVSVPATATGAKVRRPESKRLSPEELKALREKQVLAREERDNAAATKAGLSVEDYRKRRADERRALREKREAAMAAKEGITVEEFRQKRRAKHEEMVAKRLGVTVEDFRKMKPEEIRARYQELRQKREQAAKERR